MDAHVPHLLQLGKWQLQRQLATIGALDGKERHCCSICMQPLLEVRGPSQVAAVVTFVVPVKADSPGRCCCCPPGPAHQAAGAQALAQLHMTQHTGNHLLWQLWQSSCAWVPGILLQEHDVRPQHVRAQQVLSYHDDVQCLWCNTVHVQVLSQQIRTHGSVCHCILSSAKHLCCWLLCLRVILG
jgi:hypothetical protein